MLLITEPNAHLGAKPRSKSTPSVLITTKRTLAVVAWRWWLTADEDDDGGEVEGDGGMEMAAVVVAADEDGDDGGGSGGDVDGGYGVEGGGDVTAVDGGDDVGCAVEVMAMMVWRVGDDVGGHGCDNDEMVMGTMVAFV
ncbi:hypothetical protein Tco_0147119, partial [Tanacetum coccineum]